MIALDEQTIDELWNRFKDFPANECYRGDKGKEYFRKALFDSVLIVATPYGLLRFNRYQPPYSIMAHGLSDSKEVFRSIDKIRAIAQDVFDLFNVEFIEIIVPLEQRALRRLLERIGFGQVQTLLNSVFNGSIYIDGGLFRLGRKTLWERVEETTRT